jgi:hypothetical protein
MVIDACYGRAAIDANGFKPAPLGNRGLGQLAYDKGMAILVAAQSDNVAVEADGLSLLTRAFAEALSQPRVGSPAAMTTFTDLLEYTVARVPQLAASRRANAQTPQRPWLFDFRKNKQEISLSRVLLRR